jgi:hypothetical protein
VFIIDGMIKQKLPDGDYAFIIKEGKYIFTPKKK